MASITINQVRTGYRRERLSAECEELQDCYSDPTPSPEQSAIAKDFQRIVNRALDRIPPAYSMVFRMREMADLSTAETSRRLGLTDGCVKSRLLRARSMLRNAVKMQLGGRRLRPSLRGPVALPELGES